MNVNAVLGKLNKYKFVYNCNIQFVSNPYQRMLELLIADTNYNFDIETKASVKYWLINYLERFKNNISGHYIVDTCLGWAINTLAYSDKIVFRNELLKDLGVIK